MRRFAWMAGMVAAMALAYPGSSGAGNAARAARVVEGLEAVSILSLKGRVVIEPDGRVGSVKVDTALAPALNAAVEQMVGDWRFKPIVIGGVPQRATTGMNMVLAAREAADVETKYRVWVESVDFSDDAAAAVPADGEGPALSGRTMSPPGYPQSLQMRGVMGSVLLAFRITPEGRTGKVMVLQSHVYEFNRPKGSLDHSIETMERVAVNAAKRWTYNVPPGHPDTDREMTATTRVVFTLGYELDQPGIWLRVQRTPKRAIEWLPRSGADSRLGLAMASGGLAQPGRGPQLLRDVTGTLLP